MVCGNVGFGRNVCRNGTHSCPNLCGTLPVYEDSERRDFIGILLCAARPKRFAVLLAPRMFSFLAALELLVHLVVGINLYYCHVLTRTFFRSVFPVGEVGGFVPVHDGRACCVFMLVVNRVVRENLLAVVVVCWLEVAPAGGCFPGGIGGCVQDGWAC